jgi:hypothetical protein
LPASTKFAINVYSVVEELDFLIDALLKGRPSFNPDFQQATTGGVNLDEETQNFMMNTVLSNNFNTDKRRSTIFSTGSKAVQNVHKVWVPRSSIIENSEIAELKDWSNQTPAAKNKSSADSIPNSFISKSSGDSNQSSYKITSATNTLRLNLRRAQTEVAKRPASIASSISDNISIPDNNLMINVENSSRKSSLQESKFKESDGRITSNMSSSSSFNGENSLLKKMSSFSSDDRSSGESRLVRSSLTPSTQTSKRSPSRVSFQLTDNNNMTPRFSTFSGQSQRKASIMQAVISEPARIPVNNLDSNDSFKSTVNHLLGAGTRYKPRADLVQIEDVTKIDEEPIEYYLELWYMSWNIDMFELCDKSKGHPLYYSALWLMRTNKILDSLSINMDKFKKWLLASAF